MEQPIKTLSLLNQITSDVGAEEGETSVLSNFKVDLPVFKGPFDVLLHLIDEGKIGIQEISLTELTREYLEYLKTMQRFNMVWASEFLLLAAYLIEMKSRLLLPVQERPVLEDEVQEIEQDLLDHLMHYRVFKQAAIDLKERSKFYSRYKDFEAEEESKIFLVDVTLRDLVVAFQKVWDAAAASEEQEIEGEQFTVAQKIREIIDKVKQKPEGLEFEALFERMVRIEIIVTFLAMLELIRQRAIRITQGKTFGSILLFAV